MTHPNFLLPTQKHPWIGPLEVWFGKNAGFSLVKSILSSISGNIESFEIEQKIYSHYFFTAYTIVGWNWSIEGLVWPKCWLFIG